MSRPRSLWPREHGAYIQLLVPVLTALIATAPRAPAIGIALGAGLAFLASEPLRVLLGDRGPRVRETAGRRARWRLALVGTPAAIAGGLGLAFAPRGALWCAALIVPPLGFFLTSARRRATDTLAGEIAAAVALCGAATPVAVAGGMSIADALVMWGAWSSSFAATVLAVHHVLARHRRARPPAHFRRWIALVCGGLGTLIAIDASAWFAAPLAAAAVAVIALTPPATRLRTIGLVFLAAAAVSAACAFAAAPPRSHADSAAARTRGASDAAGRRRVAHLREHAACCSGLRDQVALARLHPPPPPFM